MPVCLSLLLALAVVGASAGAIPVASEQAGHAPDREAGIAGDRPATEARIAAGQRITRRVYRDRVGELAPSRSVPDIAAIMVTETKTDIRFTVSLATRFEIGDGLDILIDFDRDRRTGMPAVEGVPWVRGAELSFRLDRSLGVGVTNNWVCDRFARG